MALVIALLYFVGKRKQSRAPPEPQLQSSQFDKPELPASEMTWFTALKEKMRLERRDTVEEMPADEPRERVELEGSSVEPIELPGEIK